MKEVTGLFDIELRHATVKHPQTIGLLERTHGEIKKTLKIYENNLHTDWHIYLDYAVYSHNTSWNPKTRTTPSDLFHGHTPLKAIDARFGIENKNRGKFQTTQEIQDRLIRLHGVHKQHLVDTYLKYKKYYDKTAHAAPLKIHSYCLLLNPILDTQQQKMAKMQPKWLGLYRVEQHRTNENYLIREVGTHHTQLVHRIRLRPYQPQATVEDLRQIDKTKFKSDPKFPDQYREPAVFDDARERLRRHPEDPLEDAETAPEPEVEQRVTRSRKYTLLSADPTAVITTGRGRAPGAPPIADPPRMLPVPMPPVYGPPKTIPQPPRIDRAERVCRSQARQVNDLQNHPALAARHDIPLEEPDPEARLAPPKRRIVLPRRHSEMVPGNAPQRNLDDQLQILPHQWERFGGEPIPKMTHTVQRQQALTRPTTVANKNTERFMRTSPVELRPRKKRLAVPVQMRQQLITMQPPEPMAQNTRPLPLAPPPQQLVREETGPITPKSKSITQKCKNQIWEALQKLPKLHGKKKVTSAPTTPTEKAQLTRDAPASAAPRVNTRTPPPRIRSPATTPVREVIPARRTRVARKPLERLQEWSPERQRRLPRQDQ